MGVRAPYSVKEWSLGLFRQNSEHSRISYASQQTPPMKNPVTLQTPNAHPAAVHNTCRADSAMLSAARAYAGQPVRTAETFRGGHAVRVFMEVCNVLGPRSSERFPLLRDKSEKWRIAERARVLGMMKANAYVWDAAVEILWKRVRENECEHVRVRAESDGTKSVTLVPDDYAWYSKIVESAVGMYLDMHGEDELPLPSVCVENISRDLHAAVRAARTKAKEKQAAAASSKAGEPARPLHSLVKEHFPHPVSPYQNDIRQALRKQAYTAKHWTAPVSPNDAQKDPTLPGRDLPDTSMLRTTSGWSRKYKTLHYTVRVETLPYHFDDSTEILTLKGGHSLPDVEIPLNSRDAAALRNFLATHEPTDLREIQVMYRDATDELKIKLLCRGGITKRAGMQAVDTSDRHRVAFVDVGQYNLFTVAICKAKVKHATKAELKGLREGGYTRKDMQEGGALEHIQLLHTPLATYQVRAENLNEERARSSRGQNMQLLGMTSQLLGETPEDFSLRLEGHFRAVQAAESLSISRTIALLRAHNVRTLFLPSPYVLPAAVKVQPGSTPAPSTFSYWASRFSQAHLQKLERAAMHAGLHVIFVGDSGTSTKCPLCNTPHEQITHDTQWTCSSCGLQAPDRDTHGAWGLAGKIGTLRAPKAPVPTTIVWVHKAPGDAPRTMDEKLPVAHTLPVAPALPSSASPLPATTQVPVLEEPRTSSNEGTALPTNAMTDEALDHTLREERATWVRSLTNSQRLTLLGYQPLLTRARFKSSRKQRQDFLKSDSAKQLIAAKSLTT